MVHVTPTSPEGVAPIATHRAPKAPCVPELYTLQASEILPHINTSFTVNDALVPRRWQARIHDVNHHRRPILNKLIVAAVAICWAAPLAPAHIGRWRVPILTPIVLMALLLSSLGLRVGVVRLIARTYEFWYVLITTMVTCGLFAFHVRDSRGLVGLTIIPATFVALVADADIREIHVLVVMSALGVVLCAVHALFLVLDLVDEVHPFVVISQGQDLVTSSSIMSHGFTVMAIMLMHYVIQRRTFWRSEIAPSAQLAVQFVRLRCRMRWRRVYIEGRAASLIRHSTEEFDPELTKLRCRGFGHTIDAKHVFRRWLLVNGPPLSPIMWTLQVTFMLVGGVSNVITFYLGSQSSATGVETVLLLVGALSVGTTLLVGVSHALFVYQMDMLWILYSRFDFWYVFGQDLIAHWCLCELYEWDARSLAALSSLVWVHWAMAIDAIPPIRRQQLRIPVRWCAGDIVIVHLGTLALTTLDALVLNPTAFTHHALLVIPITGGSRPPMALGTLAVLFNRCLTLGAWFARFLWRLATYRRDDLVLVRGDVEYDDFELRQRQARHKHSHSRLHNVISALYHQNLPPLPGATPMVD